MDLSSLWKPFFTVTADYVSFLAYLLTICWQAVCRVWEAVARPSEQRSEYLNKVGKALAQVGRWLTRIAMAVAACVTLYLTNLSILVQNESSKVAECNQAVFPSYRRTQCEIMLNSTTAPTNMGWDSSSGSSPISFGIFGWYVAIPAGYCGLDRDLCAALLVLISTVALRRHIPTDNLTQLWAITVGQISISPARWEAFERIYFCILCVGFAILLPVGY